MLHVSFISHIYSKGVRFLFVTSYKIKYTQSSHRGVVVIVWQLDLQLLMQSVPLTLFKPRSGKVYFIQHYVIKFISDLRHVDGFLWVLRYTNKTDYHDITEILLKVALNTVTLTPYLFKRGSVFVTSRKINFLHSFYKCLYFNGLLVFYIYLLFIQCTIKLDFSN